MKNHRVESNPNAGANKEELDKFDPLSELFVSQASKPKHLKQVNLRVLPPFYRALLVIDGTVTKFIEAYMMEPVEIIRLNQNSRLLPFNHFWLNALKETKVITRQVILRGQYNHVIYAYASSLIIPARLPEEIRYRLEVEGDGLGRMLLNSRMETYREVLWYGIECPERLPAQIKHLEGAEFISRTYLIIANKTPIMMINEKFPVDVDQLPSHH